MKVRKHWTDLAELTEEQLRLQVVLPLLSATTGLRSVTDVHGRNEKGLDVIFLEEGSIRNQWFGLQLKRGNIGGGGTGSGTVHEIIAQLGIASDLTHPIAVDGQGRIQIEQFIVATSGRISDTARDEIASRVGRIPVVFWDGIEIARRLRKYLPEAFSAADGTVIAYLKALAAKLETLDSLDGVTGVAVRTLSQVYEEPKLRAKFDPAGTVDETRRTAPAPIPALSLLSAPSNAVIIADQDGGKTALLRMLAIQRIRQILSGAASSQPLSRPIVLHAKAIGRAMFDVQTAIAQSLDAYAAGSLVPELGDELSAGAYVVLVDGFSELLGQSEKDSCEMAITDFASRHPKCRLFVAGRPADFVTPNYFTAFRHLLIQDFDQTQVASLLNKWTKDSPALADVARKLVTRVREALQLPGSPISATIGVMLYEKEKRYITNTAEAVDRYMAIRLGRYAQELGIKQEVEWTRKQDLLAEVAFSMIDDGLDVLEEPEVVRAFDRVFDRLGERTLGQTVLDELLESGVLEREGTSVFFHRSAFRDFFSAHAINQLPQREEFFERALLDRRWNLALVFAAGLRRKNTELLDRLLKVVKGMRTNAIGEPAADYFYIAYLLGRILSNSEGTEKTTRLGVLRECTTASVLSLPEFAAAAKKQLGNIGEVAALIGVEHTYFATVGVPWLDLQFKALLEDGSLAEEERYLVASAYANLGCRGAFATIDSALAGARSTRVLLVLEALLIQIGQDRELEGAELESYNRLIQRLRRKLSNAKRREEIKQLIKFKSKLVELEIKRMKRLEAERKP